VHIDLNNPENLTLAAVRQLLASASDDEHAQLRVTKAGLAYISSGRAVGSVDVDGLLFRLETWAKGSGYVGNVAASDEVWVTQIFNALRQNWPRFPQSVNKVHSPPAQLIRRSPSQLRAPSEHPRASPSPSEGKNVLL